MADVLTRLALARPLLHLRCAAKRWRRRLRAAAAGARAVSGECPICSGRATFVAVTDNPRESPICVGCGSVPRQRALIGLLPRLGVDLRAARVHESSPSLATWRYFARVCPHFVASYYFPGERRRSVGGFAALDLRAQWLPSDSFDLVVTLDVLEHVEEPFRAFAEIARTLAPGGRHVFTVPRTPGMHTRTRVVRRGGELVFVEPPEYHRDPVAKSGALVISDWGEDLERALGERGIRCVAHRVADPAIGVSVPVEVFVAEAPSPHSASSSTASSSSMR
ncbi:MAG: class I SAM-dependent methyltransferase [Planctomycetes bacterium]|nr:class I SAM-dependent methyltransferase [Planctomycetota bacterium]